MTNLEIQAANAQINMRRDVSNILDNLKVNHPTKIDWEQRRYEIAKAVLSNPQMIESTRRTVDSYTYTVNDIDKTIGKAVAIADKLIKELKGGKPCE